MKDIKKIQNGVIARSKATKQSQTQIATLSSIARNDKEKKWSLAMTKKIVILALGLFIAGVTIFYAHQASAQSPAASTTPATTTATAPVIDVCAKGITNKTGTSITSTRLVDFVNCRPAFYQIWQAMIGLVDILVVIGFIIFALANVFHIKYDEYQAKKAIPGLIVGVIMANLSWSICLFLIGAVQHLTDIFIINPATFFQNLANLYSWMWALAGATTIVDTALAFLGVGFAGLIVSLILFLIPILIVLAIGGILWVRGLMMVVLMAAAPLGFALSFFPVQIPYLSDLAKKWFSWFWKWLFIGPVMFFLFWLAFTVNTAGRPTTPGTQSSVSTAIGHTLVSAQDTAKNLCLAEKAKNKADWNTGPCINPDIFNDRTKIMLDIVHNPRDTNIDNQAGNQCNAPVSYIEYDTNCNFVRVSDNSNLK